MPTNNEIFSKTKFFCLLLFKGTLKVLTNEKWGWLTVVLFDRSCFKLFLRKFSNKLVQALSCERLKTALRTLFLLFANNNYFPITVLCQSFLKKSVKLVCHVGNSIIAIGSLPTLQISLVIVALFEKIYYEFRFLPSSQISGMMYKTVVSIKYMMWKACRSPTLCRYWDTIIVCK